MPDRTDRDSGDDGVTSKSVIHTSKLQVTRLNGREACIKSWGVTGKVSTWDGKVSHPLDADTKMPRQQHGKQPLSGARGCCSPIR